jgi:opacity protein-like surface antigen
VGWFASDRDVREGPYFEDDTQHRWVFGGDVGWYWTEHLKSEIGVSTTTTGSSFVLVPIGEPNPRGYPYASGDRRSRDTRVVAQQIYQFGRNAWVHPYVGAGVALVWETSRVEFDQPPFGNPGPPVPPPERTETATRVKPVVSAGVKAYFSPRAFFRGDVLLSPWTSSRDVTLRAGIGVDFK